MPDMVFPNNVLTLKHQNGALLEFNALDALRYVSNGKINVQLACAEVWKESRHVEFYMCVLKVYSLRLILNKLTDRKVANIWKRK